MPNPAPRLKCRYCDYTVPSWYKTKDGRPHSGMVRLVEHVRDEHTPTDVLQEIIRAEDDDRHQGEEW